MSKFNNQQLWDVAITRFPYLLKTPHYTRGSIAKGNDDFSYLAEYVVPITALFDDQVIAKVTIMASQKSNSCIVTAFISLYLNNVNDNDCFLSYRSGQGHSGCFDCKRERWNFVITD